MHVVAGVQGFCISISCEKEMINTPDNRLLLCTISTQVYVTCKCEISECVLFKVPFKLQSVAKFRSGFSENLC